MLVAGAVIAWGFALKTHDATFVTWAFITGGWGFFVLTLAAAVHEWPRTASARGPRIPAWLVTLLIAAFVPVLLLTGATREESVIRTPFAFANYAVFFAVYFSVFSDEPPVRSGRYAPALLSVLGVILNYSVSSR